MRKLYVGLTVLFFSQHEDHLEKVGHDEGVPAIVTRVQEDGSLNLIAFLDGGAHAHEFHSNVTDNHEDMRSWAYVDDEEKEEKPAKKQAEEKPPKD